MFKKKGANAETDRNVFILLLWADGSWRCVNERACLYSPSGKPDRSLRKAGSACLLIKLCIPKSTQKGRNACLRVHVDDKSK